MSADKFLKLSIAGTMVTFAGTLKALMINLGNSASEESIQKIENVVKATAANNVSG